MNKTQKHIHMHTCKNWQHPSVLLSPFCATRQLSLWRWLGLLWQMYALRRL